MMRVVGDSSSYFVGWLEYECDGERESVSVDATSS